MKDLKNVLIVIVIIMLGLNYIKNNFNYNFMGYINIKDGNKDTLQHEVAHTIYKNLSKEDKIYYLYKINSEELNLLGQRYECGSLISKEMIKTDRIYNVQMLFNNNKLQEELFAYYIQMKIN